MEIRCVKCGRPLCVIDPPAVDENEAARALRSLSRFGLSLPPEVMQYLNPTPEVIGETFKPRCVDACQ